MSDELQELKTELRKQYGRNIAARRLDLKYTQRDLAEKLTSALGYPISQQAVAGWERGTFAPRDRNRSALAQVLRLDVHTLFPLPRRVEAVA